MVIWKFEMAWRMSFFLYDLCVILMTMVNDDAERDFNSTQN